MGVHTRSVGVAFWAALLTGCTETQGQQPLVRIAELEIRASARWANGVWTVVLFDAARAVVEKRAAQIGLMLGKLLPKGGARESFAGRPAHELDRGRIAALVKFVDDAEQATQVPGVAFGLIQHGKVVYAGGVGVRLRGKPGKVCGRRWSVREPVCALD